MNQEAAQVNKGGRKTLFGRPLALVVVPAMVLLALSALGLGLLLTRGGPNHNFRMLVSDEVNAIDDFKSVEVTIDSMEAQFADAQREQDVETVAINPNIVIDLVRLQGLNAQTIWAGDLPEGNYTEVTLHIKGAVGTLRDGTTVAIECSNDELEIVTPFVVKDGKAQVDFVFDVTVVATGMDNGVMGYALEACEEESGPDQDFNEVGEGELSVQVVEGTVVAGQTITVLVSFENSPVAGAVVKVNDEKVGTTDANGRLSLVVPAGEEDELEIEAVSGERGGSIDIEQGEDTNLDESHIPNANVSDKK